MSRKVVNNNNNRTVSGALFEPSGYHCVFLTTTAKNNRWTHYTIRDLTTDYARQDCSNPQYEKVGSRPYAIFWINANVVRQSHLAHWEHTANGGPNVQRTEAGIIDQDQRNNSFAPSQRPVAPHSRLHARAEHPKQW
jgi:hypothetical protein